jgi:hypothetical protein
MSKVAGIHNKSPETYPQAPTKSNVLQTLRGVNASAPITGSFASILASLISFVPSVAGAYATIMVSGIIQSPSPDGEMTLQIVLDPYGLDIVELTSTFEVYADGSPVPFSTVVRTGSLGAVAPQSIDVQAKTTSGSGTATAADISVVVIVTSA